MQIKIYNKVKKLPVNCKITVKKTKPNYNYLMLKFPVNYATTRSENAKKTNDL